MLLFILICKRFLRNTEELSNEKTSSIQKPVSSFYNSSSPIRRSSTTACERPFTPSFCMALLMWLRTVFSLMNNSLAISFVVLSCTSNSNTSRSRFVSSGFVPKSFSFNWCNPPCLRQSQIGNWYPFCHLYSMRAHDLWCINARFFYIID